MFWVRGQWPLTINIDTQCQNFECPQNAKMPGMKFTGATSVSKLQHPPTQRIEKVKIVRKILPRFTLRRQWHCLITRPWTWWSAWLGLKKGARRELEREGGDTETWRRRPRSWRGCFQSCEPATRHWRQSLSPLSPWSAKKALIEILIKVWHHKLMKHNDQPWIFEWTSA